MDTLSSMRVFATVAELGSFAGAARRHEMSPAMVSKHIAHLEARLNAALLTRTTRKVALTDSGARYLRQCQEVLRLVAEAEDELGHQRARPSGTLRVTAPVELGNRHVAPLVAPLLRAHPELSIQFEFTNRVVDLTEEGVDVAVRVAARLDSTLAGRQVASSRLLPVASPDYLARHGQPVQPQDLAAHQALVFTMGDWSRWQHRRGPDTGSVVTTPRLRSSSSDALRLAALDGAGVSLLPSFLVGDDLRAGTLLPLLTAWDFGRLGIHLLYPQRRYRPARLRVFVDALLARFGDDPQHDPFWSGENL
ncbi:MAG: LysR family transcriptional regulator [Burkholderiales bacterium]|nr:LysR family transcriptional regulator [Burkholderiales bacterium]